MGIIHTYERRCQRHYNALRSTGDEDDEFNLAEQKPSNSTHLTSINCPVGHFQCKSTGNCVPISAFCDKMYDCGEDDLSDEPPEEDQCTCRYYLELAAPERVCDGQGKVDCPDRGDELNCPCGPHSFRCEEHGNSTECIQPSFVCDGVGDCNNSRDEKYCIAVSSSLTELTVNRSYSKALQILYRTQNGLEGYVMVRVRGIWYPYCSNEWTLEIGLKICKHLDFQSLFRLQTIDLFQLKSRLGIDLVGNEGYDELEDRVRLLILKDEEDDTVSLPIGDIIEDDDGMYYGSCTIGLIHCIM